MRVRYRIEGAGGIRHVCVEEQDTRSPAERLGQRRDRNETQASVLMGGVIETALVDRRVDEAGDYMAIVYVGSKELRVGDKLGTAEGFNFIKETLPYDQVPRIWTRRWASSSSRAC